MDFRVGVLGATGYIGTPYREEIRASSDAKIVGLCARRRDRLEAAAAADGADFVTADWREIVESPDINLVLVCTPDALHHEAVLACAESGKHLFCEKPIGVDAQQAAEMWAAYQGTSLAHYVPFWTRYSASFIEARNIIRAGTLGDIQAVIYRWHNPRPLSMPFTWRDDASLSSAGSIADVGSHAYDAVRWLVGREAVRVLAHADTITPAKPDLGDIDLQEALEWGESHKAAEIQSSRKGTAFDYASIAWQFAGGAVGTIVLSHAPFIRKGLCPELELHGSEASLAIDRFRQTVSLTKPDGAIEVREHADSGSVNRFANHVFPALRSSAAGENSQHPDLEDGWRVQLFTDAAAKSAQRGGWVELAELMPQ